MQVGKFSRILKIYKSCFALQKIKVRQRSTNLVVLKHSRLHTKFQSHLSIGEENFKGFTIYGVAAILVMRPSPFIKILVPLLTEAFSFNLVSNHPTGF